MLPGEFDIAHSVVSRLWKSFKTTGMCSRQHWGGRVRRKQISRKTVARRLRGGGLYARRPVVCVPLTRQHRTARLQWCRERHNWTKQDWACVLFSDENLNPIENVWDALGRQVAGRNYPPTNKNTLIRALTKEWDKFLQQLLDNVVQSMHYVSNLLTPTDIEGHNKGAQGTPPLCSQLPRVLGSFLNYYFPDRENSLHFCREHRRSLLSRKAQGLKNSKAFLPWAACYEFESSATEDPPCIRSRCTLNMSRPKRPPVGGDVEVRRVGCSINCSGDVLGI
ncbi:hypothetical protein TNCV_4715621 [Trichonephila clavipes]|nr:hypothetical protein TNCV_4715621 [Trichonephila clavipes]